MYLSPPKKPTLLPVTSTRPSPPRRRPYDHDRLKLRRSILEYPDRYMNSSGSSKTMAQQIESFFNPSSKSGGNNETESRQTQPRPKSIPRASRNQPEEHARRDMTNPGIPTISQQDLEEMMVLISPRSNKRRAAEALEEPSTPISVDGGVSPQSLKRQHTNSSASPAAWSPTSSVSLESFGPSSKKMEAMAYQKILKRRQSLKRASAGGNVRGGRVIEWLNGIRVVRSRTPSPSLRRKIRDTTIRMRAIKVDDVNILYPENLLAAEVELGSGP